MDDRIQGLGFYDTKVQFIVQIFIYFADDSAYDKRYFVN